MGDEDRERPLAVCAEEDGARLYAETLRACIERGGRGDFAKALLAYYDKPVLSKKEVLFALADAGNLHALRAAFRAAKDAEDCTDVVTSDWPRFIRPALEAEFPALTRLEEEFANPHKVSLRAKEVEDECS